MNTIIVEQFNNIDLNLIQSVEKIILQDESKLNLHIKNLNENLNLEVDVLKSAELRINFLITSSSEFTLKINLIGDGASAFVTGAYVLRDSSDVKVVTQQNHFGKHTTSKVVVKGVLHGLTQARFEGNIFIDKEAFFSDAAQENKNLLMSLDAKSISVPSLEVLNNDVKCSHGSAVGFLDEEAIFYLQLRGVDRDLAQSILIDAFLKDCYEK